MRIIEINIEYGVIWYTSLNYKGEPIDVVCYGLSVERFEECGDAGAHYKACIRHAKQAAGELDD